MGKIQEIDINFEQYNTLLIVWKKILIINGNIWNIYGKHGKVVFALILQINHTVKIF